MSKPSNEQIYRWRKDKTQLWVAASDIPRLVEIKEKNKLKNLKDVVTLILDNYSKVV